MSPRPHFNSCSSNFFKNQIIALVDGRSHGKLRLWLCHAKTRRGRLSGERHCVSQRARVTLPQAHSPPTTPSCLAGRNAVFPPEKYIFKQFYRTSAHPCSSSSTQSLFG